MLLGKSCVRNSWEMSQYRLPALPGSHSGAQDCTTAVTVTMTVTMPGHPPSWSWLADLMSQLGLGPALTQ